MNDCSIFLPGERAGTYRQQGEKIDRQSCLFCPFSWSYLLIMYELTNSYRIHGPPRKRAQRQGLDSLFFQQRFAGKEAGTAGENTTREKHRPRPGCQRQELGCKARVGMQGKSWDARQELGCKARVGMQGKGCGVEGWNVTSVAKARVESLFHR
jgi:hypothetical protein